MMPIVKKNTATPSPADTKVSAAAMREAEAQRKRARTLAKQQQAAERIAAATSQLASGIAESSAAAEELRRASEMISTGAEEASGAAQESLAAVQQISTSITLQSEAAKEAQLKTESLQALTASTSADITKLVENVSVAADRQEASVQMVGELEKQAASIGEIVKTVSRIADQTNLLALNAAIEAARAGRHGKGFAVVADEVRTLAETSEKSAQQIQDLVGQIQHEVKTIAEGINQSAQTVNNEVDKGRQITQQLEKMRSDLITAAEAAREIANGANESAIAALQALKGAENIAAAAEEQAAAAEESTKTVEEQSKSLTQSEGVSQRLSDVADELKNSTDISKSAEEVASSAEELSSMVQEINHSGAMIMAAIEQIRRGAETQSAACEESSAAVTQIEKALTYNQQLATQSLEIVELLRTLLAENKQSVDLLIQGISDSVNSTRNSIQQVRDLELVSRKIDKIVDAISTVSIQTNMLAVNGAIEAARAGEYGKGFAVVAADIRNLSRDSADNADRIKDMVKAVQDQIATVSHDLDEIVISALNETEKAKLSTSNLVVMERDTIELAKSSQSILDTSNEISAAILQVKKGVEQIASAAQEAEKATIDSASAAKQQSEGAEELVAAIEEIASLADELQSAV